MFDEEESPLKSIIADIKRYLPKKGHKLIKNGLKYAEAMKELSNSHTKKCKERLIEIKFYDIDSIKPNETIYCGVNYINTLNHKMLKIMRQGNIMLNIVRSH